MNKFQNIFIALVSCLFTSLIFTQVNVVEYEYWFDNDYSNKVVTPITPAADITVSTTLPVSNLPNGAHTFHFRAKDSEGVYSSTISKLFLKNNITNGIGNHIVGYEYWFDNDYAGKVSASITPTANPTIIASPDMSSMSQGIHRFHFRTIDERGYYSSTISKVVYNTGNATGDNKKIVAYKYWLDNDHSNMVYETLGTPVAQVYLLDLIDMTQIPQGMHDVHFQFLDNTDVWSVVTTDQFEKIALPIADFSYVTTYSCDSTYYEFTDLSIDGDDYLWDFGDGNTSTDTEPTHSYTVPGSYTISLTVTDTGTGADSTITENIFITGNTTNSISVTECNEYTVPSGLDTYNTSGIYVDTLPNQYGCDSLLTIDLTINFNDTVADVITACDSYTWINGNTYTSSNNIATHTLTNIFGCDSIIELDLTINYSNTGTDVQSACDSYTWIDGNTYTASNTTATHVLTNAAGCDSTVTLDLTMNYSTTGIDVQTACDSYTWIDGNTYTASNNTATHVLNNAAGCDSIVTLDLTINYSTTGTDVQTACDSYTWIDGNTYTSDNNTATHVLTNAAGCDSIVTLDLTINYSTTGIDVQTACDSYTWIDGNTYSASNNTATHVLTNAAGCDSIVTLDLTINYSTTGIDVQTACDLYTWIDGNTYTADNNTATHVLTNAAGCDSTVTLDLIINTVDATVTQIDDLILEANAVGADYQWLDCDANYAIIPGETSQTFVASVNGNYAVLVTENNCSDTSTCIAIMNVDLSNFEPESSLLSLYPNPTNGKVHVSFGSNQGYVSWQLLDSKGRVLREERLTDIEEFSFTVEAPAGVYFIRVNTKQGIQTRRIIKR